MGKIHAHAPSRKRKYRTICGIQKDGSSLFWSDVTCLKCLRFGLEYNIKHGYEQKFIRETLKAIEFKKELDDVING